MPRVLCVLCVLCVMYVMCVLRVLYVPFVPFVLFVAIRAVFNHLFMVAVIMRDVARRRSLASPPSSRRCAW